MAKMSRTWWGERFLEAIAEFAEPGRLQRGRSYSSEHRLLKFNIDNGSISATVRGNVNPYFGVYKEPKYSVKVSLEHIPAGDWPGVIQHLSSRAGSMAKLLLNEMPDSIEESFEYVGQNLLPVNFQDFKCKCSCPDWSNPCKHIAGVCYRLAKDLDRDPFLLFELRGLSRDVLQAELLKSPLGQLLATELKVREKVQPESAVAFFSQPTPVEPSEEVDPKVFWQGQKRLPKSTAAITPAAISAILVKKQGDYPAFWEKDKSFIEVMEEVYQRVRTKNQSIL